MPAKALKSASVAKRSAKNGAATRGNGARTPPSVDTTPRRGRGRPTHVPVEDPLLLEALKLEDLSWIPEEVRGHRESYQATLRIFLACKSVHKGVNDIDRMQLVQFSRAYLRMHQFNALAQQEYDNGDTAEYTKAVRGANGSLNVIRALLRDMKLLRVNGLKIASTTPTDNSSWKGLL